MIPVFLLEQKSTDRNTVASNIHGVWTLGGESWGVLSLAGHDLAWQGELDLAVVQLRDGRAAAVLGGDWGDLKWTLQVEDDSGEENL